MLTTDLICLVLNALWGGVLVQIEAVGKTRTAGMAWNVGNRETEPTYTGWVVRAQRALANHKENFPLFLTAVLVVHLAGRADHVSAVASVVYVVARALHGLVFIAGITRVRSAIYLVSAAATLVVFSRLLP